MAGDTTARGDVPIRPNYQPAIARYEDLVRRYPQFSKIDAAAYTLGTLYFSTQRYADAVRMFELVTRDTTSRFRPEAFFRLGDSLLRGGGATAWRSPPPDVRARGRSLRERDAVGSA